MKDHRSLDETGKKFASAGRDMDEELSVGTTLPDLKKSRIQNKPPKINAITNAIGWILLVISGLIGFYMLQSNVGFIQAAATFLIPSLIAGLLLISVAWALSALNSIKVSMMYQAEMTEHQFNVNRVEAANKEIEARKIFRPTE
jgi:hypothetical protein